MNTAGTTTWYAFQDPKTGREYFHEPVTGDKSWVLPTSSHATSNIKIERSISSSELKRNRSANSEKNAIQRKKSMGGWSVGITIVSILVFNTLFLLVLVKILYDSNDGQMQDRIILPSGDGGVTIQTHGKDIKLELSEQPSDDTSETMPNKGVADADPKSVSEDEPFSSNDLVNNETGSNDENDVDEIEEENTSTTEEPHSSFNCPEAASCASNSPDDATEPSGTEAIVQEDDDEPKEAEEAVVMNYSETETIVQEEDDEPTEAEEEVGVSEGHEEKEEGTGEQSNQISEELDHDVRAPDVSHDSPVRCWIPFSFMFVEKCRHQVREGLPMPLADAENYAWI